MTGDHHAWHTYYIIILRNSFLLFCFAHARSHALRRRKLSNFCSLKCTAQSTLRQPMDLCVWWIIMSNSVYECICTPFFSSLTPFRSHAHAHFVRIRRKNRNKYTCFAALFEFFWSEMMYSWCVNANIFSHFFGLIECEPMEDTE